jgi:hypothetical protein
VALQKATVILNETYDASNVMDLWGPLWGHHQTARRK